MQFDIPFVLVSHPKNVVLVGIEASERQSLKIIHHLLLLFFGWCVFSGERDHAAAVFKFVVAVVDQRTRGFHVSAQHLRRRLPRLPYLLPIIIFKVFALAVGFPHLLTCQVFSRTGPPATASGKEFNQHRRPPAAAFAVVQNPRGSPTDPARWPATRPELARHQHRLCSS